MPRRLRDRLSFANVVSLLALFVALGGTGYAAAKITGKDIANSSITTKDVKNKSLRKVDFKPKQLPRGRRGRAGATNVTVRTKAAPMHTSNCFTSATPGNYFCTGQGSFSVVCAAGERATGGGIKVPSGGAVFETRPQPESGVPTGWFASASGTVSGIGPKPTGAGPDIPVKMYVLCAAP
jgi:hypothetical protein